MTDLEEVAVYQAEETQCVAAAYATAIRAFSKRLNYEDEVYPSLSDLNQVVKDEFIEVPLAVDNPDDEINQKFFRSVDLEAVARKNQDFERLERIYEDEECSLPIVSLHPDYLEEWQDGVNTGMGSGVRHMVIVEEMGEDVKVWDPLNKPGSEADVSFQNEIPKHKFVELWRKEVQVEDRWVEKTPAEIHWFRKKALKGPQQTL